MGARGRMHNYRYVVPTTQIYKELKILKFNDIYKYFLLKFVNFCVYKRCDLFFEYFYELLPNHGYSTRGIRINLPAARLDVEKHFALYQACKYINETNELLLQNHSQKQLKTIFKNECLLNY